MLAKRFFYVCAGLLCLALAYHLGVTNAAAKPSPPFRVLNSANPLAIVTGDQIYLLSVERGWTPPSDLPPVPVSSLQAGDGGTYVTVEGTAWHKNGYTGAWDSFPLPGSAMPAGR